MFKIGDKIRCIDNSNKRYDTDCISAKDCLTIGKKYKVIRVDTDGWPYIECDNINYNGYYDPERFVLES